MNGLAGSPLLVGGLGPGPLLPTTKSGREAAQDRGRSLLSMTDGASCLEVGVQIGGVCALLDSN